MLQESGEIIWTPPPPAVQGNSILCHCWYLYQLNVLGDLGSESEKLLQMNLWKGRRNLQNIPLEEWIATLSLSYIQHGSILLINFFYWSSQSVCFIFCLFFSVLDNSSCCLDSIFLHVERSRRKTFRKILWNISWWRYKHSGTFGLEFAVFRYVSNMFQLSCFWCLLYFSM